MKNILKIIVLIIFGLHFGSCSKIYQVGIIESDDVKMSEGRFSWENADLFITYDFWGSSASMIVTIQNKQANPIFLDLGRSNFIYDGRSFDYWSDETYSATVSDQFIDASSFVLRNEQFLQIGRSNQSISSLSRIRKTSITKGVASRSKREIQIPPKGFVVQNKFSVSPGVYFDCDFNIKGLSKKAPREKDFLKTESPLSFRNFISYSRSEKSDICAVIDHEFYFSKIVNVKERLFLGRSRKKKVCDYKGYKKDLIYKEYPYAKPNSYFMQIQ